MQQVPVGEDREPEPEPEAGQEAKPEAEAEARDTAWECIMRAVLAGNGATGVVLMAEASVRWTQPEGDDSCGHGGSCPKHGAS